jgi:PilZ domain
MALAIERRTSARMSPGALGADVLIMHEMDRWMKSAKLLDISAGGALIRSEEDLTNGQRLRMLVQDVPELGWIDAEIVRSAGPSEAGVRLIAPFRPELVLAATTGRRAGRDERAESKTPFLGDAIPIW